MIITALKQINSHNSENSSTSLFHYVRPKRGKIPSEVEMYGFLSVSSNAQIPAQKIIKFAWDGIVDGFEYSNNESFNESLKLGLQESKRRLKQLVTSDSNIAQAGIDINFSVFVFNQKTVYVGIVGENDIFVYKNGRLVDVTEMLLKKQASTAGLVMEENDLLITSTKDLIKKNISKIIGQKNKECIKEKIDELKGMLESEEGYVTFDSGVVIVNKQEECIEEVSAVQSTFHPQDLVEPVNSDYVPPKEEKIPLLQPEKQDKDLKHVVGMFSIGISRVWKGFTSKVKASLRVISGGLKSMGSRIMESVKKSLGHKKFFKKVSAKVSQSNVGRRRVDSDLKGFRVDGYRNKAKRFQRFKIVFLVVGGIALLVFGVKFTIDQREAMAVHREAEVILTQVEELVSKAEGKVYTDRVSTETYLFQAQTELESVPEGLNKEDEAKRLELEGRVLGLQDDLYKRSALKDSDGSLESYIDTRLAFGEGSNTSDITLYRDDKNTEYLIVTDPALKAVYRVSLFNKEVKKLPDDKGVLQKPTFVYMGKSGVYVLDTEVGVVRAKYDSNGWFNSFETLTGLGIGSLGAENMSEFAVLTDTDNIYIVDRIQKALLKSSNFGSGYGLSFSYISHDSFENANEILSDLSVYILTSGSDGLRRYNFSYVEQKQVPAPVEVVGVNGDFKNLAYGYTQQSLDYGLYVFDSEDRRFMNFEKPKEGGGEVLHPNQLVLQKQYLYRGEKTDVWNSVHDFVVDSKEQNMYVLDGSTIWKVRL